MSHSESCRELLAMAEEIRAQVESDRQSRSGRLLECLSRFVATHNGFVIGGYHAVDFHLREVSPSPEAHTSFLLYVNRDKYMSEEVKARAYRGHELVNSSHQSRTDKFLATRLKDYIVRGLSTEGAPVRVEGRNISEEDYVLQVWNMTVTLRIVSHSVPNVEVNVGGMRVRYTELMWLKVWVLQQLSLSHYAGLWSELYPVAQKLFRARTEAMPEHHYEPEFTDPELLEGCVVAGTGAICEYARILGKDVPDISRGITLVAPSSAVYGEVSRRMGRYGDVKHRPGMEDLFLRKAYVFGRGARGREGHEDFRAGGHDVVTVTLFDCSHSCLNSYLGVDGRTRYAGYYTVLMYLYYDLLTATYYSRDTRAAERCQHMINLAARLRAKFLQKNGLVGHEQECGPFRVFDTECTGVDTTKDILFRREKWINPSIGWFA